jgi:hypothetical protein
MRKGAYGTLYAMSLTDRTDRTDEDTDYVLI